MNAQWADWLAVGLLVGGAAAWLTRRMLVNWRRQRDAKIASGACSAGCAGCPFSNGCGSQTRHKTGVGS